MSKTTLGLISFAIILGVLLIFGISFYDAVWTFPGNFDFFKSFPSNDLPLGSVPLMVIMLVGSGVYVTIKFNPRIRKSDSTLKDNALGSPIRKVTPPKTRTAECLDHPFSSTKYETTTSNNEIAEVKAAIANNKKNKTEKIYPPDILVNTTGNVWKINPGPADGFCWVAKTAVKIAIPAIRAIIVSKKTICNEELNMLLSFSK